jgi:hypothetical protein
MNATPKSPLDVLLLAMLKKPRRSYRVSLAVGAAIGAGAFLASFHGVGLTASEIGLAIGGLWVCATIIAPTPDLRDIGGAGQLAFSFSAACLFFAAGFEIAMANLPSGEFAGASTGIFACLGFAALAALGGVGYRATCRGMMLQEKLHASSPGSGGNQ